jgi:hypothetical protein
VERLLRKAMILPIWEGTPQRQVLDGIEAMERREAHHLLVQHLAPHADSGELEKLAARLEAHLALDQEAKEARAEQVFSDLAAFTASTLLRQRRANA